MSSTSSSDCESCDCSQCKYLFENNQNDYEKLMTNSRHVPMYATMAHPFIYYTEIQQPLNRRQTNDQPRRDNPFKKAFKWYTQERGRMISNKTEVCPERSGFANWLDDKYDEFLRESGKPAAMPVTPEPRTPRNSTAEPEQWQCPGASQRYGRFKSPWRKRRTSVNDGGDVPEEGTCGSCAYILKPKELTRAISEHTPTSGGKSTATVTSSNMPCNVNCSGRSRSLSGVGRERSVPKHGDTVTHFAQGPKVQEQESARMPTMFYQEQVVQVPSKINGRVTCKCKNPVICACPSEKMPKINQVQPCCLCPPGKAHVELEKVPLIHQIVPCCICEQEKVPQVPLKTKTKNPKPLLSQEKSEVVKVPSIQQDPNLPDCPFSPEKGQAEIEKEPPINQNGPCYCKVPQIEKLPSKTKSKTKNPKLRPLPSQEKSEVVKVPSLKQDLTKLPCCPCPQEKEPKVEKLPSQIQDHTYPPALLQEKLPEVMKVPSKTQDPNNRPIPQQETAPEVAKVPLKDKYQKNQSILEQENIQQVKKLPSDQPGPCCKCNLKKVPEVVQVPSQSRAVQESCQVPEDKLVPVNEGTQYDSTLKPSHSTQKVRPCCCNTCNPPFPPPPIICLPVKVQSSKITSPETCLISPSSICDVPKRQKKQTQRRSVSCQFDEGNKSEDTQCQHQNEPCLCSKPCCSNCHSLNQVGDSYPLRRQSYSTVAMLSQATGEVSIVKEVAVVNKFSRTVTCASNDAAQTSDHSICFDKDGICSCQCPLFLKIIYADIKE